MPGFDRASRIHGRWDAVHTLAITHLSGPPEREIGSRWRPAPKERYRFPIFEKSHGHTFLYLAVLFPHLVSIQKVRTCDTRLGKCAAFGWHNSHCFPEATAWLRTLVLIFPIMGMIVSNLRTVPNKCVVVSAECVFSDQRLRPQGERRGVIESRVSLGPSLTPRVVLKVHQPQSKQSPLGGTRVSLRPRPCTA